MNITWFIFILEKNSGLQQCHYQRQEIRDKIRRTTCPKALLLNGSNLSQKAVNC